VTDNLTGLIWLQNAYCAGETRTWQTALNDVAQLNTNGQMNGNNCGDTSNGGTHQTDWRLPNVREMQSLVHYGFADPALPDTVGTGQSPGTHPNYGNGDPFYNVRSYHYWTSTTYAADTSMAWRVFLGSGLVYYTTKTGTYCVWPVRDGQ
jgi:hypothetical protein